MGRGYSDHLPIFAFFSTAPFKAASTIREFDPDGSLPLETTKKFHGRLDLNTADRKSLMGIRGVGPALAARIIPGRPYKSGDDLVRVEGIGPKQLKQLRKFWIIR